MIGRRALLTGAAALAAHRALADTVTPQIGGSVGQGFDGALGAVPFPPAFVHNFVKGVSLPHWRSVRPQIIGGTARGRYFGFGDSTKLAWGAGIGGLAYPGARALSSPVRMAAYLASGGIPTCTENAFSNWATGSGVNTRSILQSFDPRFSITAGWGLLGAAQNTIGGETWANVSSTTAFSLSLTNVDTINLFYPTDPTYGTFSYQIDSGSVNNVPQNAASGLTSVVINTTLGAHTLTLNRVSGTVTPCAVLAYNSTVPALDVVDAGWGGSKASDWIGATAPWSPLNAIDVYQPTIASILVGINDAIAAVPPATFGTQLQTWVTKLQLYGDVIIEGFVPTGGAVNAATQATYLSQMATVAANSNSIFVNWTEAYGSYNAARMFDTLHPLAPVYDFQGKVLSQILSAA